MNKSKNIGILEYHYHTKYLYTIAKIVKTKKTNVTIFTTSSIFSKLKTYLDNISDYDIILKEKNESLHSFLKRIEKICDDRIDLLFVNTIQESMLDLPRFFFFNPKSKMILTIHSVNSWFSMKPELDFKRIFRTVDTNLSKIFARLFVLPKFDGINVIYPPIKEYIGNEIGYKKPVFKLPFGFFNNNYKNIYNNNDNNKILFVVPGQIEEHRRDYDSIIDAFQKTFEKDKGMAGLILLGYPVGSYGKNIIKKCEKFKEKGYDITFYNDFVPESEYNKVMKTVDFLILPIKTLSSGLGVTKEYYGLTKGSAALYESIQYGLPTILPEEFNSMEEMKSSTIKYRNIDDLSQRIFELSNDKELVTNYKNNALNDSNKLSIDVLHRYFEEEILNKIERL